MKKSLYIMVVLVGSLFFIQCAEDDNNNIIESEATCDDGLLNGDEDGIDCGGSLCEPCEEGPEGIDFTGTYVQEDQAGRPGISILLITEGFRDIYNTTIPSETSALFKGDMLTNLNNLNPDYTTNFMGQDADAFTTMLADDVLWVAQTGPTTFYDGNTFFTGRRLTDDVMDVYLKLLFGGPDENNPINNGSGNTPLLISDGVDENDKPFLNSFPYLAPPF